MFNRASILCLVVGALAGYAAAGTPMTAQSATMLPNFMYQPGTNVLLAFKAGALSEGIAQVQCSVTEVNGDWVRCKSSDSFQEDREQRWYDMKRVVQIIKRAK